MAAKTSKKSVAGPIWTARPHPSGEKLDYKEVTWPLPKPPTKPTLPTLPPPTSSVPPTLPVTKPVQERPVTKVVTVIPTVQLQPSSGHGVTE